MAHVTVDVSSGDSNIEVEYGRVGTEVELRFEEAEITISYEQAENLYRELKPYFEIPEDDDE